jgi:probable rRNA maturation factor
MMAARLCFAVDDDRWNRIRPGPRSFARRVARSVDKVIPGTVKDGACISVLLSNDAGLRRLNRQFRGMDRPTNVLSFETGDGEILGDIALSFDAVEREAPDNFSDHLAHLFAHGVLHLLGYDHMDGAGADAMEAIEVKVLREMEIENPYE